MWRDSTRGQKPATYSRQRSLPWRARYDAYGVGRVVFILLQAVETRLGIGIRRPKTRRLVGLRSYHRGMKLLRYRRPSLRNLSGYTQVKRRAKRQLGISQVQAWTKPSRVKQRAKQHVGYYSPAMRVVRNTAKCRFPSFLGLFRKK